MSRRLAHPLELTLQSDRDLGPAAGLTDDLHPDLRHGEAARPQVALERLPLLSFRDPCRGIQWPVHLRPPHLRLAVNVQSSSIDRVAIGSLDRESGGRRSEGGGLRTRGGALGEASGRSGKRAGAASGEAGPRPAILGAKYPREERNDPDVHRRGCRRPPLRPRSRPHRRLLAGGELSLGRSDLSAPQPPPPAAAASGAPQLPPAPSPGG